MLRYLDGDMRIGEQVSVGMHLDACPACRMEYEALGRFVRHLRSTLKHPHPRYRWRELLAAMETLAVAPVAPPTMRMGDAMRRLAVAGLVALALCMSSPLLRQGRDILENVATQPAFTSLQPSTDSAMNRSPENRQLIVEMNREYNVDAKWNAR